MKQQMKSSKVDGQDTFLVSFKTEPWAKPLIIHSNVNKTNFHWKNLALGLILNRKKFQ